MRLFEAREGEKNSWALYALAALAVVAMGVGFWARLYHLGFPPDRTWDEIYFPAYASDYLNGVPFFDLHPPLGKFIIAIGILIFGDDPLGWRIMPAVAGIALVGLAGALGLRFTGQRVGALLFAALMAAEVMFVSQSRLGLMDGMLVLFMLATLLAALWTERREQVIWVVVLLGLTIAIKWAALMVAVPAGYVLWRKGLFRQFFGGMYVSVIVYVAIVYAGQIINPTGAGEQFNGTGGISAIWNRWILLVNWHEQAFANLSMGTANTESSAWWTWPLLLYPIRMFRDDAPAGGLHYIYAIGNPIIWWSATLAVVASVAELARRVLLLRENIADHPLVPVVLGYAALLLPWTLTSRLPYLYNYLPVYAFALLALVWWGAWVWGRGAWGRWAVVAFGVCAVAVGIFYLPLVMGLPMDADSVQQRVWLDSWSPQRPNS